MGAVTGFSPVGYCLDEARDARAAGIYATQHKKFAEAEEHFTKAIKLKPRSSQSFADRGALYLHMRQYANAVSDFTRAIALDRRNSRAFEFRGFCYTQLQQYDKAINDLSRAIALIPDDAQAYQNRAAAYAKLGKQSLADKDLMTLKKLGFSARARRLCGRGRHMMDEGRFHDALRCFDKAIEDSPNYTAAYFYRADARQKIGQFDEALKDCDVVLQKDSNFAQAHKLKGICLYQQEWFGRAVVEFSRAISLDSHDVDALMRRADARKAKGDYAMAVSDMNAALKLEASPDFYAARAELFEKMGNTTEALHDYNKLIQMDPDHAGAYLKRANLYVKLKRLEEALRDCSRSLASNSKDELAYSLRANIHQMLGHTQQAIADYKTALSLDPGNAEFYKRKLKEMTPSNK